MFWSWFSLITILFSPVMAYSGKTLSQPVNMLVCGAGYIYENMDREVAVWTRDDDKNLWYKCVAIAGKKKSGIRSFQMHTDKTTLKQWLFCGITEGDIIKAAYNASIPGTIVFDTVAELRNLGRIMAMCECNGDLYAAAGVDVVGKDTVGGLYKRVDGESPSWELIYRWKYTPLVSGDEANIMRGITCVPDPKGSGNTVIIGTRANPGIVEVIEPKNNNKVTGELYIKDFFTAQWGKPYQGVALSAYNNFVPDTIDGKEIWWQSLWVENKQADTHPYNGSHFLVRYKDGTYKYGDIFDNNNPLPNGKRLRACRTICKSPFPEEPNTYYFGGYDCAKDTSKNTSWIYKGVIKNTSILQVNTANLTKNRIVVKNDILYINGLKPYQKIQVINLAGKKIIERVTSEFGDGINIAPLRAGIYLVRSQDFKGKIVIKN